MSLFWKRSSNLWGNRQNQRLEVGRAPRSKPTFCELFDEETQRLVGYELGPGALRKKMEAGSAQHVRASQSLAMNSLPGPTIRGPSSAMISSPLLVRGISVLPVYKKRTVSWALALGMASVTKLTCWPEIDHSVSPGG